MGAEALSSFRGDPQKDLPRSNQLLRLNVIPPAFVRVAEPMFEGRESNRPAAGASEGDLRSASICAVIVDRAGVHNAMGPSVFYDSSSDGRDTGAAEMG